MLRTLSQPLQQTPRILPRTVKATTCTGQRALKSRGYVLYCSQTDRGNMIKYQRVAKVSTLPRQMPLNLTLVAPEP